MKQEIRAVAFDIDGTLYSNASMYRATALFALRHLRLFSAFGRARKTVRRENAAGDLENRTVELTAQALGWDHDRTRERIRSVIYRQWEARLHTVEPYADAREVILWLRDMGIKTAAMSDFPTNRKLEILGLDHLWDVSFSSEETGYLKPQRAPFDRLARDLELPAANILYVGNSYTYDVLGAKAAGMQTAHRTRHPVTAGEADVSFATYAELREWLRPRIAVKAN